jgi:cbb3-type cytochrome c oxidase subunit III
MLVKSLILTAGLLLTAFTSMALDKATPAGLEYCTVCHGSQLTGNPNIGAPRLSDLSKSYVERQLHNFKSGIRGAHSEDDRGGEMRPMVSALSDEELSSIAQWVANTNSSKPKPTLQANTAKGEALYQTCVACHGANAQGNDALGAPKLSGLNDWYLATQLNHFRLDIRGNKQSDTYGQQMKAASKVIASEQDVANLAAYISQLN